MLPIILDVSSLKVAVIGNGLQAVKRLDMLRDADVSEIDIFSPDPRMFDQPRMQVKTRRNTQGSRLDTCDRRARSCQDVPLTGFAQYT